MRSATVHRQTRETDITVEISLDGKGNSTIDTGIGFLDHMLTSFAKHGLVDLMIKARGDLQVDDHHTVEDIGISLGEAYRDALKEKTGIERFGHALVPMDEALAVVAVDISGRGYSVFKADFRQPKIGDYSTAMTRHFIDSFARSAGITINVKIEGEDDHHMVEAMFKALGLALSMAAAKNERRGIPSTKGVL
ncbi:imidazoleglycerol-phosphate dehydratase HisB [Methanocella arvoryzae]|uniref:Imidazoleglycerol-phosphate dehydratase n=1 Tax=Methanocella arvoryzae (strain DSM 22066 / NBRC 105507 / MRE50) TaxID=351160 RepID=HIS7_METAR|nr:imidazoleglycerol-phosphate dehydratase HisB [Methanocella arvoryzae]Q0W0J2.1 RecName: Full=Imidazoleglycerol-phosphate dehydratase; Short=IGPD [Methanocella arvoryzae MRE50]CAJ38101.1 putative imidazoleglycerol-phosphate dehydratase [Methanocella arvoryzae MRE50]